MGIFSKLFGNAMGAGASVLSTVLNNQTQKKLAQQANEYNYKVFQEANAFNAGEADKQRNWEEEQYINHESIQAKVAEAEAAGINPAAIYGNLGNGSVGSGTSASSASAPRAEMPEINSDFYRSAMEGRMMQAQAREAEAKADIMEKDADNYDERYAREVQAFNDTHSLSQETISKMKEEVAMIKQQASTEKFKTKCAKAEAAIKKYEETIARVTAENQPKVIDLALKCQELDNQRKEVENEYQRQQIDTAIEKMQAEIDSIYRLSAVAEQNANTNSGNLAETISWHDVCDANEDMTRNVSIFKSPQALAAVAGTKLREQFVDITPAGSIYKAYKRHQAKKVAKNWWANQ